MIENSKVLVEIVGWNCGLHVMPLPPGGTAVPDSGGGSLVLRDIEVQGVVRQPEFHAGAGMRIWLSPRGVGRFEPLDHVGDVELRRDAEGALQFLTVLRLPECDLDPAIVCLGSAWRFLGLTLVSTGGNRFDVLDYALSRSQPSITALGVQI